MESEAFGDVVGLLRRPSLHAAISHQLPGISYQLSIISEELSVSSSEASVE